MDLARLGRACSRLPGSSWQERAIGQGAIGGERPVQQFKLCMACMRVGLPALCAPLCALDTCSLPRWAPQGSAEPAAVPPRVVHAGGGAGGGCGGSCNQAKSSGGRMGRGAWAVEVEGLREFTTGPKSWTWTWGLVRSHEGCMWQQGGLFCGCTTAVSWCHGGFWARVPVRGRSIGVDTSWASRGLPCLAGGLECFACIMLGLKWQQVRI